MIISFNAGVLFMFVRYMQLYMDIPLFSLCSAKGFDVFIHTNIAVFSVSATFSGF